MDENLNAVNVFNKVAALYEEKYFDVSAYSNSLDFFCNQFEKPNPKILELACGPGNISNYLIERRTDIKLLGTDLSENMIRLAIKNNPMAEFRVMDSKKIGELQEQFDGVVCGFLFPYLTEREIEDVVKHINSKLNLNGILYISTIENKNEKSGPQYGSTGDYIYMNYYELKYFENVLNENNFKILYSERVNIGDNNNFPKDLIIVCQKKSK